MPLQAVPESQLLVFNVKQGWEPLCTFLQAKVPKHPFPKKNSKEEQDEKINNEYTKALLLLGVVLASALGVGVLVAHRR